MDEHQQQGKHCAGALLDPRRDAWDACSTSNATATSS
jgi:hypothetical protein